MKTVALLGLRNDVVERFDMLNVERRPNVDVQLEQLSDACQLRFNRQFLKTLIERLAWTSNVLAQVKK